MIDDKALRAAARAVLHRRIEPDFFEVKDGAWTVDHDKVVAEAAILAYESAKQKGEAEGLIELAAACPTIVKAGKKLTADRVSGKVVVGGFGDVPAVEFKRLAAMLSAGGEG